MRERYVLYVGVSCMHVCVRDKPTAMGYFLEAVKIDTRHVPCV